MLICFQRIVTIFLRSFHNLRLWVPISCLINKIFILNLDISYFNLSISDNKYQIWATYFYFFYITFFAKGHSNFYNLQLWASICFLISKISIPFINTVIYCTKNINSQPSAVSRCLCVHNLNQLGVKFFVSVKILVKQIKSLVFEFFRVIV